MLSNNGEILARVIMGDAFQEAEAILEKAEKEAVSIRQESVRMQAEMRRQAESDQNQLDIFLAKAKMISQAELQARMELIDQKEEILQGVLDTLRKEFFSLPGHPDYPSILMRLTLQGLAWLEGDDFICQVNSRDRVWFTAPVLESMSAESRKKLSLDEQVIDIEGGVVIVRRDGRLLYDNSLGAIFQRKEEAMRSAAARQFFRDEESGMKSQG
ncbi:MAG: V-type ATP synthase subunit E [bacterium]